MARSGRHGERVVNAPTIAAPADTAAIDDELFLEPMMGTPLQIYIEKSVSDRDQLVEIITRHGGQVAPGYSTVPYILVDPYTEAGQTLYRQYAGRKGKIVLNSQWIYACVQANELQTYHTNWAGCKVTGLEQVRPRITTSTNGVSSSSAATAAQGQVPTQTPVQQVQAPLQSQPQLQQPVHPAPPPQQHAQHAPPQHQLQHQPQATQPQPHSHPSTAAYAHQQMQAATPQMLTAPAIGAPGYAFPVFAGQNAQRESLAAPPGGPPQPWQTAIQQQHIPILPPRSQDPYARENQWQESTSPFAHMGEAHLPPMNDAQTAAFYDERYRDGQHWAEPSHEYYDQSQSFETPYQQDHFVPLTGSSGTTIEQQTAPPTTAQDLAATSGSVEASLPAVPPSPREESRGRKKSRPQIPQPPPAVVANRRQPLARSPTPPTRVIKSTYGGNLFTADDIEYLKKYIDYCHEQGLVLSLREICERIAIKAPHHSFYSWRRYCNKHQIRLGGYAMDIDSRSPTPTPTRHDSGQAAVNGENANPAVRTGDGPFTIDEAMRVYQEQGIRDRSPTPPRAMYRSTTGKGVAFTSDDVAFLCKFMAYRRLQGRQEMVAFWKDVSIKAPHHSRASWMKFYRRHKHELNRAEGDDLLPAAPAKKLRYGRGDDVLLAIHFARGVQGTSDQIFQEFAKLHPHHPWKGWQEHFRIHKAKIDHLIQRLRRGEVLESIDVDDDTELISPPQAFVANTDCNPATAAHL